MTQFEFVMTALALATMVFTAGFLFGIGYQQAEDGREIRRLHRKYKGMLDDAKKNIEAEKKAKEDAEWHLMLVEPQLPWEKIIDFEYGDESTRRMR